MRRTLLGLTLLASLLALSAALVVPSAIVRADDDDDAAEAPSEAEASAPAGPRMESGRTEVSAVIDRRGAVLQLQNKARIEIPAELPVANRRVRFAERREPLPPAQVAEGFVRVGPVLGFDGQIDATRAPVVVSIASPRDPARPGRRLVLAMEQPAFCGEGSHPLPGVSTRICSGWEFLPATYSAGERRLSARMPTPGGYRLVFGTLPCAEGDSAPGCATSD